MEQKFFSLEIKEKVCKELIMKEFQFLSRKIDYQWRTVCGIKWSKFVFRKRHALTSSKKIIKALNKKKIFESNLMLLLRGVTGCISFSNCRISWYRYDLLSPHETRH